MQSGAIPIGHMRESVHICAVAEEGHTSQSSDTFPESQQSPTEVFNQLEALTQPPSVVENEPGCECRTWVHGPDDDHGCN